MRFGCTAASTLTRTRLVGVSRAYSVALPRCMATDPFKESGGVPGSDPKVAVIVDGKKQLSPKVLKLAADISELTLLETAELCEALKVRQKGGGEAPSEGCMAAAVVAVCVSWLAGACSRR